MSHSAALIERMLRVLAGTELHIGSLEFLKLKSSWKVLNQMDVFWPFITYLCIQSIDVKFWHTSHSLKTSESYMTPDMWTVIPEPGDFVQS